MGVWWAASRRKQHLSLKNLLRRQQTDTPSTTMSEEKLGKLRGKLKEITEHIDEADQSKVDAVQSTGDAVSRLEKLETELQSSQRRTQLVAKDLSDINERLAVAEEKLNKAMEQSEEIEASREELESNLKDMKRTVEMNLLKVVDGDRKNNVCNNEIAKLREKAEKNEAIVTTLEEQIEGFGKRLEELEELEGAAGEREDLNEEKVTSLEGQLKETETRADAAERMLAVLSNVIVEMETEIAGWTQKIVDMEHTMVEMDNLADDPNYDLPKKYGKTAASAASPSGFGSRSAMFETKTEESDSRASSRASMRGGSLSRNHRRIPRRNRNPKRRRKKRRKRRQHLHQLRNRHTPSTGDHPQLKIPTKSLKKNPLKRSHLMKNNFVETSLKMLGELCLIRKVIFNHELGRWNQRLCYRCRKNEKR